MEIQVIDFLTISRVSVVGILQKDSSVHSAALHFAYDKDSNSFYFMTDGGSRKCASLQDGTEQNASVVIGFSEEDFITFQAEGRISITKDGEFERGSESYTAKFSDRKAWLERPGTVILKFTPTWWHYKEMKVNPPLEFSSI